MGFCIKIKRGSSTIRFYYNLLNVDRISRLTGLRESLLTIKNDPLLFGDRGWGGGVPKSGAAV